MERKIAILTDCHGLLEPTQAVLEDIHQRGIEEIYSLGDNIGFGPNPGEVIDLLEENKVISIAGNAEEYITLGLEPFSSYMNVLKTKSCLWTLSKLNERQKGMISLYPHSIELLMGGKKIALCHFINDVRFDYGKNSTWTYQRTIHSGKTGYSQFLHTNSTSQLEWMHGLAEKYGNNHAFMRGVLSALQDPLFGGKRVELFDAIIQGHVHFKIYEKGNPTEFYTIRAVGMGYQKDPIDTASYVILTEKENSFQLEEILVRFDREKMIYSILNNDSPDVMIKEYVSLNKGVRK